MRNHWTIMALALVLLVIFFVPSCTKKRISSEPATTTAAGEEARKRAEEEARQKALEEEDLGEEGISGQGAEELTASEKTEFENEDIYFEFDSINDFYVWECHACEHDCILLITGEGVTPNTCVQTEEKYKPTTDWRRKDNALP